MNAELAPVDSLPGRINAEHRAATADAESAVAHARRCGELLLEARSQAEHGQWLLWLAQHCPEVSEWTAQAYMRVARAPAIEADSLRTVLARLSAPRKAKPTVRDASRIVRSEEPKAPKTVESSRAYAPDAVEDVGAPNDSAPPGFEDGLEPDQDEAERLERMQAEYSASVAKIMEADDRLSAAHAEIKRQAAEIAALKGSRDHFQNKGAAAERLLQAEQSKIRSLGRKLDAARAQVDEMRQRIEQLEGDNEALRERVAIIETEAQPDGSDDIPPDFSF